MTDVTDENLIAIAHGVMASKEIGACGGCETPVFAAETKAWDGKRWWHGTCWPSWISPLDPPGTSGA